MERINPAKTGTSRSKFSTGGGVSNRVNYKKLLEKVVVIIETKKGHNTLAYDVRKLTSFTDYLIITDMNSSVQIEATLKEFKKNIPVIPDGIEGTSQSGWVLVDYGGVVINLFTPDLRRFYSLERIWGEAKNV